MMLYLTGLIQFFKSPLGMGIGAVAAVLVYVQFQRHDAAEGAAAECKAEVYQTQIRQLQQSVNDMEKLANTNRVTADLATAENEQMEKERDKAVVDLRATQNECRRFDPAQRKRVLNLKK